MTVTDGVVAVLKAREAPKVTFWIALSAGVRSDDDDDDDDDDKEEGCDGGCVLTGEK